MEEMTITKDQLEQVVKGWIVLERAGKTRPKQEADALPLGQLAQESTEHIWRELQATSTMKR